MIEMPKKLQLFSVDKLIKYEKNSRLHSSEQIDRLAESMKIFGFTNPILINNKNEIIAGHGRLEAAKKLGLDKVPVIQLEHLTEEQLRAYIIADNRLAELSTWDTEILKSELSELKEIGFELDVIGFDDLKLSELFSDDAFVPNIKDDEKTDSQNDEFLLRVIFENDDERQQLFLELRDRGLKVKV